MGSQLVVAVVEQRSVGRTNPDNITPNPSHPITQEAQQKQSSFTSIIEQASVRTVQGSPNSPSRPIEQVQFRRSTTGGELVEQRGLRTSLDPNSSNPIEQAVCRITGTKPLLEQRNAQTSITTSKPVEQVAPVTNTINLEQFDFIDLIFPNCGSIRNPVNTDILWRLNDFGFPFDVNTLIFRVNGIEVQDNDTFIVTGLPNGIQIDYDPAEDFEYDSEVPVYLEILDTAPEPNRFVIDTCSFFTTIDSSGPQVLNFTLCGQTNVDSKAVVEFDVVDFQTGVRRESIELNIEGIGICQGLVMDAITTPSGSGYHVTWIHPNAPFRYGSTVTAAVQAEDLADPPNGNLFVCRFQIEQSTPPEFLNFDPGPCQTFVDNTTGLTFEIYGVIDGVDISTLEVVVDNKRRRVYARPRIRRYE